MWSILRAWMAAGILCACAASPALADDFPNDYYYSKYEWYSTTIGLPKAWSISTGSSSVIVAVLDTGVVSYTPDLSGRILTALSAVSGQAPFTDAWLTDTTQTGLRRHGTWVASAAAMGINNSIGGAGVGNFSILPIRIANTNLNALDSSIVNGIYMAADNGAKVINISYYASDYALLDTAAAYARSKGALTFIAAGNTDSYRSISSYTNLIFVSGTNQSDQRWSQEITDANGVVTRVGSSYGPFVDISAPAEDILLADPTTIHGYGLNSGTSFATPLVAGAAALAWSINPNLTADEVEQMLYSTADDLGDPGWDQIYGWGRLNVGALAAAALATVPEPAAWLMLVSAGIGVFLWRRHRF
ncbi:MAG: S8 family serine peptidase [Thermoguttaceae bacterium]|jgi:subtilisin family serine protease